MAGALFAGSLPLLHALRIRPLTAGKGSGAEPVRAGGLRAELADGLRHIRRHPLLRPLVLALALCELGLSSTLGVGLLLLDAERGWGAAGYGWIVGAFGAGAAASAALLTAVGWVPRAGLVLGGTLGLACAGAAALGFVPVLGAAAGCAALTGLAAGAAGSLNNSLLQYAADPAYLGRVTSVVMLTMVGLAPLSYPVAGAAIGAWGAGPVFAGNGGALGLRGGVPAPEPGPRATPPSHARERRAGRGERAPAALSGGHAAGASQRAMSVHVS
ncbi:PE-PGRS family protein [Streptomyces sp. SPB074]|nr:PE-PGRS family protein [Streptomyces sp. SPB074]